MNRYILFLFILILLSSCEDNAPLPILGETEVVNGLEVPHAIRDFSFFNQDSVIITNENFAGNIYVADFFFTSCPSICPVVTKQMLRIYETFQNQNVNLVSYTMDPKRDIPAKLKSYAEKLEVSAPKWQFLTGEKDKLHEIAADYFSIVIEDDEAPGGFNHSGYLLLVDKNRHIRSFCIGTDEVEVTEFIKDIKKLLAEDEK